MEITVHDISAEYNTAEMLREVRLALLEADVALPAVREFITKVKEKSVGEEVIGSLTPGQALVGVVQRELASLMGADLGPEASQLNFATQPPAIILMAGLQGAGKTTTVGKLAKYLRENTKKKVLTVSADVYRPAAIGQLETVTAQAGADFFPTKTTDKPVDIALAALDYAKRHFHDVLIIDTAGRLGIDEAMMQEISAVHAAVKPIETLFVVDAMLGQDAINTAKAFSDALQRMEQQATEQRREWLIARSREGALNSAEKAELRELLAARVPPPAASS